MKQIIKRVLEEISTSQVNLSSASARDMLSDEIESALNVSGEYKKYTKYELDEQEARKTWVCGICGKNTFEVEDDYIGSGTNHLGCELELEMKDNKRVTKDRRQGDRREKNYSQKKHEDKVFGHDQGGSYTYDEKDLPKSERHLNFLHGSEEVDGMYFDDEVEGWEKAVEDMPEGLKRAKELSQEALEEGLKRQLSEEIVDNKDEKYIYESPDGGKTIYRRKFGETERELHKEKTNEG